MSIFSLITDEKGLRSANEQTSKLQYEQFPPSRSVGKDAFSGGAISFRFETSGQKWFNPSKTYLRTRFILTRGDGTPLHASDGIAPNMDMMPNLFQNCEFRIQDKPVSSVPEFLPQVDALETRLNKSKGWLDSIGNATNYWNASQNDRVQEVSQDGVLNSSTGSADRIITTHLGLGYGDALTTSTYDSATGRIVFALGLRPNCNTNFKPGDYFVFNTASDGAGGTGEGTVGVEMRVIAVLDVDILSVEPIGTVDVTGVLGIQSFSRIRKEAPAARRAGTFETVWQPPLSIFKIPHALPAGKYELILQPQTASIWKAQAIESALGSISKLAKVGGNNNQFEIEVVDMFLVVQTVEGLRVDDITYLLDLQQTNCQVQKVDGNSFGQKSADISPSTYAITIAYQDQRAGTHTAISSTKFKSYEDSPSPLHSQELKLIRGSINYGGQTLPSPDYDGDFKEVVPGTAVPNSGVNGKDYTVQAYTRTQLYSGSYFDNGGSETLQEWHARGAYYYYAVPRDGTDRSTRLTVYHHFQATDAEVKNLRVLMFSHSYAAASVRISAGRIVDVQVEQI